MNSTECQLQRSHLWEKTHLLNFFLGQEALSSEGSNTSTVLRLRGKLNLPPTLMLQQVKLAGAGDMFRWRQLVKQIKPHAYFDSLIQRRHNELEWLEQPPKDKERFQAVDESG